MTAKSRANLLAQAAFTINDNTQGEISAADARNLFVDEADSAFNLITDTIEVISGAGTAASADIVDFATAGQGALADSAVQPADLATVATSGSYADLIGAPTPIVQSIVAGENIIVDATDPVNPIVSATSGLASVAPIPSGSDDTAAMQAWINSLNGDTGYIPPGHYLLNAEIINQSDDINIFAHPNAILDFSGSLAARGFTFGGGTAMTALPALNINHVAGRRTLEVVSDPNVVPGDVCVIWNDNDGSFNPARPYYKKGEMFRVLRKDVNGDNLALNWSFETATLSQPAKGAGWSIAGSAATKAAGSGVTALQWSIPFTVGATYRIRYQPTGATGGTLTPSLTGGTTVNGSAVSGNTATDQNLVAVSGNNTFNITASDPFNGSLPMVRLQKVGNFIFLEDPLTFAFNTSENLSIQKMTMRRVNWSGGYIIGNVHGGFSGIYIEQGMEPIVEEVRGENCAWGVVWMVRCFRGRTVEPIVFEPSHFAEHWSSVIGENQEFALNYIACYEHIIERPTVRSGRQSITFTGGAVVASIPNIRCIVQGGVLSGSTSMDMHGGCKDCAIYDAICNGAVNIGGEGSKAQRLIIRQSDNAEVWPFQAIHYREIFGNEITIEGIRIIVRGQAPDASEALIHAPLMSLTGDGAIVVRDIVVDSNVAITNLIKFDWTSGLNVNARMRIEGIDYRGPGTPTLLVDVDPAGSSSLNLYAVNNVGVTLSAVGDVVVSP